MREYTKFSKILVAIWGSDASMKAADVAAAKNHRAKLFVVTALKCLSGVFINTKKIFNTSNGIAKIHNNICTNRGE